MPAPVIEIQDLEKRYRGSWFRAGYHALRGVTLDVRPGEIFALLGPNGAGKTTLIKVLLGIVRKSSGEARLLGSPAGHQASRRKVGYLPEHLRLPRHHTAETALALLGKLSGMSNADIHARRDDVLQRVGLSKWADVPLRKYSKGMLQRLGLGQALLHEPELLILDEPTDGLDPVGRRSVRTVLESLRSEGKTIFINSHLLQEVELFCDRIAILSQGKVRHLGTVAELSRALNSQADLVTWELAGADPDIQAALAGHELVSQTPLGDGAVRLTVRLADQAAIDRCLDQLRQRNVSVMLLSRQRLSLEDAFLNLIEPVAQPVGANL